MEGIDKITEALAKAQGAFTNPERTKTVKVRTKTGDTYTFRYSPFGAIMDMIRKPLADNVLAVSFLLARGEDGGWLCFARLLHPSGQFLECPFPILIDAHDNEQGWSSSLSYAKRYAVCALLGIAADDDDDGNAGCGNHAEQVERPARPPAKPAPKQQPNVPQPVHVPSGAASIPFKQTWESCETDDERFIYMKWRLSGVKTKQNLGLYDAKLGEREANLKPGDFQELVLLSANRRAEVERLVVPEGAQQPQEVAT